MRRLAPRCASGWTAGSTAFASTRSTGCSRTLSAATTACATAGSPLVLPESNPECAQLEHNRSRNAPDIVNRRRAVARAAVGDAFLVGEDYLRSEGLAPYLTDLDAAFSFELFQAPWTAGAVRDGLEAATAALGEDRAAWVLSNHDFPRLPQRVGARNVRSAALLLLSLPGAAFVFQGDEIGMGDGPGRPSGTEPDDRSGRDAHRHPMAWDATANGGFTTGTPWLPVVDPAAANVADQERDPGSLLHLYRDLIALRREALRGPLALIDGTAPGVLAFTRGDTHIVVLNLGDAAGAGAAAGAVLRHTHDLGRAGDHVPSLAPGEGFIATTA